MLSARNYLRAVETAQQRRKALRFGGKQLISVRESWLDRVLGEIAHNGCDDKQATLAFRLAVSEWYGKSYIK